MLVVQFLNLSTSFHQPFELDLYLLFVLKKKFHTKVGGKKNIKENRLNCEQVSRGEKSELF